MGGGHGLPTCRLNHTMADLCRSNTGSQHKLTCKINIASRTHPVTCHVGRMVKLSASNQKVRGSNPGARGADELQQERNSCPLLH